MTQSEKTQNHKLIQSIEKKLMSQILSGELTEGEKLPTERELATRMQVSRSSVHQAFLTLEREGFLTITPRRGATVNNFRKHPTPQSLEALMRYDSVELQPDLFQDMMETRIWLESECVRRACTNIYDSTLLELRELVKQMDEPGADLSYLIYQYHYQLTQASGNSLYSMIFRGFEAVIRSLIVHHYEMQAEDLQESIQMRYSLLNAIEHKEETTAVDLVCRIINQGVDVLRTRY